MVLPSPFSDPKMKEPIIFHLRTEKKRRSPSTPCCHLCTNLQPECGNEKLVLPVSIHGTIANGYFIVKRLKRKIIYFHVLSHYLSNPKPRHTTSESAWGGARWRGGAGQSRVQRDTDGPIGPGINRPSCPPEHRMQLW